MISDDHNAPFREKKEVPSDEHRIGEALVRLAGLSDSDAEEFLGTLSPHLRKEVRDLWDFDRRARGLAGVTAPPSISVRSRFALPYRISENYELRRHLGRGGFGEVFEAVELNSKRMVAVKVLHERHEESERGVHRFRREADALLNLSHPNVATIFAVQLDVNPRFIVMELIRGGMLAKSMAGRGNKSVAGVVEKLALAVEAAHRKGIFHRDLKPQNVLCGEGGEPKIVDFGLASRTAVAANETAEWPRLTEEGMKLGTLDYIAPEQLSVGPENAPAAIDIYGLGTVLYELLTGSPPLTFADPTDVPAVYAAIRMTDPLSPKDRVQSVHDDLANISLQCLRKEPNRRYATAAALAADLRRFIEGKAVSARPESLFRSWCRDMRRRPAFYAAITAGLFAAIFLLLGVPGVIVWDRLRQQEIERSRNETDAENYLAHVGFADRLWSESDLQRASGVLASCPEPLRQWEWHYQRRRLGYGEAGEAAADTPLRAIRWLTKGKLAVLSDGDTTLWAMRDGKTALVERILRGGRSVKQPSSLNAFGTTASVELSANGGENELVLHQVDGEKSRVTMPWQEEILGLALAPDGNAMALRSKAGPIRFWEPRTKTIEIVTIEKERDDAVPVLAWDKNGSRLAASRREKSQGHFLVWEMSKKAIVMRDTRPDRYVSAMAFDAAGMIAVAWTPIDNRNPIVPEIHLWSLSEPPFVAKKLLGPRGRITAIATSADGRFIASASLDRMVRLWSSAEARVIGIFRTSHVVTSLDFDAEAPDLTLGCEDGKIRRWKGMSSQENQLLAQGSVVNGLAFERDGDGLISVGSDGVVRQTMVATGQSTAWGKDIGPYRGALTVVLDSTGQMAATSSRGDHVKLWSVTEHRVIGELDHANVVKTSFSQVDALLCTADMAGELRVWDSKSRRRIAAAQNPKFLLRAAEFSPDGKWIAFSGSEPRLLLWDFRENLRSEVPLRKPETECLAFDRWGRWLAIGTNDGTIELIDWTTKASQLLEGHGVKVTSVLFDAKGERLFSGSDDGTIKVWDVKRRREILSLTGHTGGVESLALRSDGLLASSSWDFTIRLWDGRPWREGGQ